MITFTLLATFCNIQRIYSNLISAVYRDGEIHLIEADSLKSHVYFA
jgi:hypothetical protein